MKKTLLVCMLLLTMIISLVACGGSSTPPNNDGGEKPQEHIHSYGEWEVTKKPTCTEDGTKVRYCSCGEKQSEVVVALGHSPANATVENKVDATYDADGSYDEVVRCSTCNEKLSETTHTIPMLKHTPLDAVEENRVEPTCYSEGSYDMVVYCGDCGAELSRNTTVLEKIDHTPNEPVVENRNEATCTEAGSYNEVVYCSVEECKAEIDRTTHTIDPLEHVEVTDDAVAPTCTATGLTEGKHCSRCNVTLVAQNTVDALGHVEVTDDAVAPTCTATGLTEGKHCSRCNEVLVAQTTVNSLGHVEVTDDAVAPTCTDTGLTEGSHCSRCNETLVAQNTVDALGHTEIIDEAIAPDCTSTGLTEGKHCSVCNEVLEEQKIVPATGHTYEDVTVAPTCTAQGYTMHTCVECGARHVSEYIEAIGHDYITHAAKAVTCRETGWDAYNTCSRCDYTDYTEIAMQHNAQGNNGLCLGCGLPESSEGLEFVAKYNYEGKITSYVVVGRGSCSETDIVIGFYNGKDVTSIDDNAFASCNDLTSVVIGGCVKSIGYYAFYFCYSLNSVEICSGVTSIDEMAFSFCHRLTSVFIPDSVTSIESNSFYYCESLSEITVGDNNTNYMDIDGNLYTKDGTTLIQYAIGKIGSFTIPSTVTNIGDFAFKNARFIDVVIPASVKSIGQDAFYTSYSWLSVYYQGTENDWAEISIASGNSNLTKATRYYYSAQHPTTEGNYWCFDDNEEVVVWCNEMVCDEAVEPTCTESGLTEGKHCSVCGEVIIAQTVVPALGHTEVIDKATEPTCTETGLSEGSHCSRCNETLVAQNAVDAHGHVEVTDDAVAPTCTETGLTEGKHCSRCNVTLVAQNTVDSLGHVEVTDDAVAPTCTATGLTEGSHCSRCNETLVAQSTVNSLGHVEVTDNAVEATCTTDGKTEGKHCSRCNEVLVAQTIVEALGHRIYNTSIVDAIIDIYTTINNSNYPFSVSGNQITSTNKSNRSSSTYTITAQEAFTLDLQYKVSSETNYDKLIIKHNSTTMVTASGTSVSTFTSLSINMSAGDTVTITYSKDESDKEGSDCAWVKILSPATRTAQVEKTELVTITESNRDTYSSCTKDVICDICGIVAIEKIAHIEVVDEAVSPTCGATGLTEGKHCSKCGKIFVAQNVIPATGNHTFGEWVTTKSPTTKEEGLKERTCACGAKETQVLDKIIPELTYSLNADGKSYFVTGIGTWDDANLVIPSTYNNLPVSGINESAFKSKTFITSATLPDSIKIIGDKAFYGCSNLKTINIPSAVTSIGDFAFDGCSSLTYNQYSNAYYLGNSANPYLMLCKSTSTTITSCTIHSNTVYIYSAAFSGCNKLTSITIPTSIKGIGLNAFYNCSALTKVSITNLANWCNIDFKYESELDDGDMYYYCWSNPLYYAKNLYLNSSLVTTLTIPSGVTQIKPFAFYNANISKVSFGSSITTIGIGAFKNCTSLTTITIPSKTTTINDYAFCYCAELTSVTISKSVNFIGESAFSGCTKLNAVYITDLTAWCNIEFGGFDANPLGFAKNLYLNKSLVTTVTIPSGTTEIKPFVFSGASFTKITLPTTLKTIGRGAFYGCSSLTEISIPSSVTFIGYNAFYNCNALTAVHITSLDAWCKISFAYDREYDEGLWMSCSANPLRYAHNLYLNGALITDLVIPSSITDLGNFAFQGGNFNSVTLPEGMSSISAGAFQYSTMSEIYVPDSVTTIYAYAFNGCSNLRVLVINNLTDVGSYAVGSVSKIYSEYMPTGFNDSDYGNGGTSKVITGYKCFVYNDLVFGVSSSGIAICLNYVRGNGSEITIPETVTYKNVTYTVYRIGENAFKNHSNMTKITIPNTVTRIEKNAFYQCTNLETVSLPTSLEYIGDFAFYGCSKLKNIVMPNSLTTLGEAAFLSCTSLTGVTLSSSLTKLNQRVFEECSSLELVILPKSITSIDYAVFRSCTTLSGIVIPTTVANIANYVFYDCPSLTVYYTGSSDEWSQIQIGSYNTSLSNDIVYYYSGTEPTGSGNYWHYSNNKPITWSYSKGLTYKLNGSTYTVTGIGTCTDTHIIIPSEYNGLPVTSIGSNAFSGCNNILAVTIPDSITSIDTTAFLPCKNIVEVYNFSSLNITAGSSGYGYVAYYAIAVYTSNVKSKVWTTTDGFVFYEDSNVAYLTGYIGNQTSLTLPESCNGKYYEIANKAFYDNSNITEVIIPDGVTKIGKAAFLMCENLTSVTIGNNVTAIGESAFSSCYKLSSLVIGYRVISIGDWAFESCKNLTSTITLYSVTSIGEYAFRSCSSLTSIELSDSVTTIGNYAFYNCSHLTIYAECSTAPSGWDAYWNSSNRPVVWGHYIEDVIISDGTSFEKAYVATSGQSLPVTIDDPGEYVYFVFTATESKTYTFRSSGSVDTYGYLYNSNQSQLSYNDDGAGDRNFSLSKSMTAGETVYIGARLYSSASTGTFTLEVI